MNYAGVYLRLIESRRLSPPLKSEYVERHHIVPRSVGGTDAETNLIYLRPEDHFFAHLLLAKAYGGRRFWAAVKIMSAKSGGARSSAARVRRLYGMVKRQFSVANSGRNNNLYDVRIFDFIHADGRRESSTKHDLCLKYHLDIRNLTSVCSGRKKSLSGWTTVEQASAHGFVFGRRTGTNHPAFDHAIYTYFHEDRRLFEGTRFEFANHVGIDPCRLNGLHAGDKHTFKGWCLADRHKEFPSRTQLARRTMASIKLKHADGRTTEGLRQDVIRIAGVRDSDISNLLSGKVLNAKGWMLPETDPSLINLGGKPPPSKSKTFASLTHSEYGRFSGSGGEFRKQFYPDMPAATSHFAHLVRRRVRTWNGWRLARGTALPNGGLEHDLPRLGG